MMGQKRPKHKKQNRIGNDSLLFLTNISNATSEHDIRVTVVDQCAPQPGILGKYRLREALRKFGR